MSRSLINGIVELNGYSGPSVVDALAPLVTKARQAANQVKKVPKEKIATFLDSVGDNLEKDRKSIVEVTMSESHYPQPRCENELTRTINQLKLFGKVVAEGSWVDARLDGAVRSMFVPLGPVAVFGASNFPLAFSTLGGDTASALAARCPVIYKTHPAHPKTTERCNAAVQKTIKDLDFPEGYFQIAPVLSGAENLMGQALVTDPAIQAVGFTGSRNGGLELQSLIRKRPVQIPFYGELSAVNPLFVFPDALKNNQQTIAQGLAQSFTLGVGQFCTKPGLVFAVGDSNSQQAFIETLKTATQAVPTAQMLTENIHNLYVKESQKLESVSGVKLEHKNESSGGKAGAAVYSVSAKDFANNLKELQQEVFGPATLVVRCQSLKDLPQANHLEGQLTASVHATEQDLKDANLVEYVESISGIVGRVIIGGFPTGVEVNHAMVHGGPFPSTTDPKTTSVGTRAILRWVRPLCYQSFPEELLPAELQQSNPLKIRRLVNGTWEM